MTRTQVPQELRRMRFEEAGGGWRERRPTQEEAARLGEGRNFAARIGSESAPRARVAPPG